MLSNSGKALALGIVLLFALPLFPMTVFSSESSGGVNAGAELDISAGAGLDISAGAELDISTGAELDISTGAGLDISTGAGLDISAGAGLDISTGADGDCCGLAGEDVSKEGDISNGNDIFIGGGQSFEVNTPGGGDTERTGDNKETLTNSIKAEGTGDAAEYNVRGSSRSMATRYIIITPEAWESQAQQIADWRTQIGMPAEVHTTESIQSSTYGRDLAERIHNFLVNKWDSNPELDYVLLFGDSEYIPARMLYAGAAEHGIYDYVPSDHYYAALESDWDGDMDGDFGEDGDIDLTPDICLGRWPVSSGSEANRAANRILGYLKYPPSGAWTSKAVLVGGLMAPPNHENYDPESDNAYKVQQDVLPVMQGLYTTVKEYYDHPSDSGGDYIPEGLPGSQDNLNHDDLIAEYNTGASVANMVSQGYTNGNGLGDYAGTGLDMTYNHLFYYTDCLDVTNGNKLPFVYVSSCNSGNFTETDDTNLELLLPASSGGAIGLIAGTQLTYRGETATGSYGNWWLNRRFWTMFSDNTVAGECFRDMKQEYYEQVYSSPTLPVPQALIVSNIYTYTFMGDPAMHIWTAEPTEPELVSPQGLFTGFHNYTFHVRDGNGSNVQGAMIYITGQGHDMVLETGPDGKVETDLDLDTLDDINVTITGPNILPLETELSVGEAPPDLSITDFQLPSQGVLGSLVDINVTVKNTGEGNAQDFVVGLYSPTFAQGNKLALSNPMTLYSQAQHGVEFELTFNTSGPCTVVAVVDPAESVIELDEDNNMATDTITIVAPDIAIESGSIKSAGVPTVGSPLNISLNVTNLGDHGASGVEVYLFDADDPAQGSVVAQGGTLDITAGSTVGTQFHIDYVSGEVTYYAMADPYDAIMESNEDNNMAEVYITPNQPPSVASIPALDGEEDHAMTEVVDLGDYCSDTDGPEMLTYRLISVNSDHVTAELNGSRLSVFPGDDWFGVVQITIGVSDGAVEVPAFVSVDISPVNDPPEILAPEQGHIYVLDEGEDWSLTVEAADREGDELRYSDDTALFNIDRNTGEIGYTAPKDDIGRHNITLTVSDGEAEDSIWIELVIRGVNHPPKIETIGDHKVKVGETFRYTVVAEDEDGDTITYNTDSMRVSIDRDTGEIEFKPGKDDVGTHNVTVYANDGRVRSQETFTLVVEAGDDGQGLGAESTGLMAAGVIVAAVVIVAAILWMRRKRF